jgi:ABC-type sugar transport system ATPase subunit
VQAMQILEVKNLSKKYENNLVLSNISFKIKKGEIIGLVGDNGAGKSTLMKCVTGSEKLSEGKIYFKEEELNEISPIITRDVGISMVYQNLNICKYQTVWENIFLGRELENNNKFFKFIDKDAMKKQASKILKDLYVNVKSDEIVNNLSGGQQQSVAIAQALVTKPSLLILDEPTSALSLKETNSVINTIKKLKEIGVSVIVISHRLSDIFEVSDRIITLKHGKKILDKMKDKTSIEEVAKLIIG